MAGGFWKGILHGVAVGGLGLAGLSLMTPLHEQPVATLSEKVGEKVPVSVEAAPRPVQTTRLAELPPKGPDRPVTGPVAEPVIMAKPAVPEPLAKPEPQAEPEVEQKPQMAIINLPPGSEFGRGNDRQLQHPLAFAPAIQSDLAKPPLLDVPLADSGVSLITAVNQRPRANSAGNDVVSPAGLATEETPKFIQPTGLRAPEEIASPIMVKYAAPDSQPIQLFAFEAEPETAVPGLSPVIPSGPQKVSQDSAPALPRPAFNLSMPPDLSNLRASSGN